MMFLAEGWRHGRVGALELGTRHGAWCLGWMALIAAFIAGEKLLPWPTAARRTVAVLLLALGLGIAFLPAEVPGFAEPGSGMNDGGGTHGDGMQMMR